MARHLRRFTLGCLLVAVTAHSSATLATQKRILVVYTARVDSPSRIAGERALESTLNEALGQPADFYSEYIDPWRLTQPDYESALSEFLSRKYAEVRFDLIVTIAGGAFGFVSRHPEMFPGVPAVFGGTGGSDQLSGLDPGRPYTGLYNVLDFSETLNLAIQLQLDVQRVYVVSGVSETDRTYEALARQQFKDAEKRLAFTYLIGLSLDELQKRVATLPAQSIVFNLTVTVDGAGTRFIPADSIAMIAPASAVPVYSFAEGFMGSGMVGGSLASDEVLGREVAKVAARILLGARPQDIPVAEARINVVVFDWRQLQRWRISEARLPAGSLIRFREPTLWDTYKWRIVGAISLFVMQALLIATLLVQRQRRRSAEHEQRKANQSLHRLSGRLLLLQDEERRRVAGELHDGLGQSLAIIKNRVTICQRNAADQEQVNEQLNEIAATAAGAIAEVREIAHNLRPYELDRLGLVAAIQSMIGRVSASTDVSLTANLDRVDGLLSLEAETSVYRILQEGLNNVIRHSHATTASVEIKRTASQLIIIVQDNGIGLPVSVTAPNGHADRGFGLTGISERVRLLGGAHAIDVLPAGGTRLTVRLETSHGAVI